MKQRIGSHLFNQPQMDVTGAIITNQDDEFMRNINEKYEGAGGQSAANPIQGFNEGRKTSNNTILGKISNTIMGKFGHSIKEYFVQNTPIEEYTKALLDLIQFTYFIEEWLKCVLLMKKSQKQNFK